MQMLDGEIDRPHEKVGKRAQGLNQSVQVCQRQIVNRDAIRIFMLGPFIDPEGRTRVFDDSESMTGIRDPGSKTTLPWFAWSAVTAVKRRVRHAPEV